MCSINILVYQFLGSLLKNVNVQGKSQDSISEEPAMSSDERESQAGSMTTGLDWNMISSDSGTEGKLHLMTINCLSNLQDNLYETEPLDLLICISVNAHELHWHFLYERV